MMIKIFLFGFLILLLTACGDLISIDEAETASFSSEYAIPIIDSQVSMKQILESTDDRARFSVAPDGELSVIYDSDALSLTASELLLPIPVLFDVPLLDTVNQLSFDFIQGIDVKRAVFKNNSIQFKARVIDSDAYQIKIKIPSLFKDDLSFEYLLEVPANASGQEVRSPFIPLTDWELISGLSAIEVIYDARNSSDERVVIPDIRTRIDFLIFSYVEGKLSTQVVDIEPGDIPLDAFRNYISGSVDFEDPFLRLIVDNSFGVPIEPLINELNISTNNGEVLAFDSPLFERGFIQFDFPDFDEIGQSKRTVITLNKENSNILELIDERSESVTFDIDAIIFPRGSEVETGFIRDDGAINIISELVLPLSGKVDDYFLFDNYPIDTLEFEEAEAISFNLGVANGLPLGINLQMDFLNDAGEAVAQLFSEPIEISAAEISIDGLAVTGDQEVFTSSFDRQMIDLIMDASSVKAIIGLKQTTEMEDFVSILDSYQVDIQLGLQVKVKR